MAKILVTGGCGYIGSHTLLDLIDNGYEIISVDNNSRSSTRLLEGVEKITGKKMKFFDRVGFKIAQKKLRSSINHDGTLNSKKLEKNFRKMADGGGFHLGGFALGFLLGLIGVLVAYLLNDDLKSSRVKWAWLGLLAGFVFWLLIFVALL